MMVKKEGTFYKITPWVPKKQTLKNEDKIGLILLENELNQAIADGDDYQHRFLRK